MSFVEWLADQHGLNRLYSNTECSSVNIIIILNICRVTGIAADEYEQPIE